MNLHEAGSITDLGSSSNYSYESLALGMSWHVSRVGMALKTVVEEGSLRSAIEQGLVVPNTHWNLLELVGWKGNLVNIPEPNGRPPSTC